MGATSRKFAHKGYFHTRHCPLDADGFRQYTPVSAFHRLELAMGLQVGAFPVGMILEAEGVRWEVTVDATLREVGGTRAPASSKGHDHLQEVEG